MNKLLACMKKDFKLMISKSIALITMFLLPLFFMAILLYNFSDILYKKVFMEPFSIMVLDKDNSKYASLLIEQFKSLEIFRDIEVTSDEKVSNTYIEKEHAALIIIPENFIYGTSIGKNPPISVLGNKSMPFRANLVKNLVATATNLVISGQSSLGTMYYFNRDLGYTKAQLDSSFKDSLFKAFMQVLARKDVFEDYSFTGKSITSASIGIVAACLTLFIGFSGMPVVKILIEEKINKVSIRLKLGGVGTLTSFLSKFLITLLISIIQILVLYYSAIVIFQVELKIDILRFIIMMTFAVFGFSGFITFVAIISKTHFMADILGNLTLFFMALCTGCFYPAYTLPQAIRILGHFTIHGQVMDGLVKVFNNNSESILYTCSTLFILGFGFYFIAFLTEKYKELA